MLSEMSYGVGTFQVATLVLYTDTQIWSNWWVGTVDSGVGQISCF